MNAGIWAAVGACVWWGFFPLYFSWLPRAFPAEVLANRIVWSFLLISVFLLWQGRWRWLADAARQPRTVTTFVASSLLLSLNWVTYIWAASSGHVIDASLGYFIVPLVNVACGYALLGERPRPMQWLALASAAAGVLWLTVSAGRLPWIGLVLGVSFGIYGVLRKIAVLGPVEGFAAETIILAPVALVAMAWWWGGSPTSFPSPDAYTNLWLVGLGPATAVPLLLFAMAARRIPLMTLGMLQYLGPTIQFALGVLVFHEPLTIDRLVGFCLIWAALAIYSADGWRTARRPLAPA